MARLSRRRQRAGLREKVEHEPRKHAVRDDQQHEPRPTDFIGANGEKDGC
jgi:hypothetical protein